MLLLLLLLVGDLGGESCKPRTPEIDVLPESKSSTAGTTRFKLDVIIYHGQPHEVQIETILRCNRCLAADMSGQKGATI